jgi:uncharacterized FlaG/YvyC family protein
MPPAKRATKKSAKNAPEDDVLGTLDRDLGVEESGDAKQKSKKSSEEEVLDEVSDEDLDFSFLAAEVEKEEKSAEAPSSAPPQAPAAPAESQSLPDLGLDEDELADMQAAINENLQMVAGGEEIGQPNKVPASPEGAAPPAAEGELAQKAPESIASVETVPLTAENLQPATEKIAELFRVMRELIRELSTNLNIIANDKLKETLEKLTIDTQAEEETIKEYNGNAANFLAALVEQSHEEGERGFKESELRKGIATIYEEHRECTEHIHQLTDHLQALAEDESLPPDQKGLLSVLDLTFVIDLANQQMEGLQGILTDLTIDLEALLKQKQTDVAAISDDLQQKIEDEIRMRSEAANLPPVSPEEFIAYAANKRDRIWYHALWFLVFTTDEHQANKKSLYDALKEVTSKSAIDDVKENVFYFGLGPLLKVRLEDQTVIRYRDQNFKLNVKVKEISDVLQEIGEPISPRPQVTKEAEKDMIDSFLSDDFLDI